MLNRKVSLCLLVLQFCAHISAAPSPSSQLQETKKVSKRGACNCACGVSNRQMRVVGGNTTKVHEFPWIAGLSKGGEFKCGATLITRRHLLTAAHCVNGFATRDLTAVLADHNRSPSAASERLSTIVVRGLRRVKEHEKFDVYGFDNDIAIVELDQPVDFNANVQPACLPSSSFNEYMGRMAVVAGWGKLSEGGDTSPVLQKAAVPVWSPDECYRSDYGKKKISKNMFCAGYHDGARDACQGDSGGPLHMSTETNNMEIIGVVSWGRGCGRPNLPGIYTKVENYLDWVKEAIGDECLCSPLQ